MTNRNDNPFRHASHGALVTSPANRGTKGVYVGRSLAGTSWVRWLKRGELRNAKSVQLDVATMSARLLATNGTLS